MIYNIIGFPFIVVLKTLFFPAEWLYNKYENSWIGSPTFQEIIGVIVVNIIWLYIVCLMIDCILIYLPI